MDNLEEMDRFPEVHNLPRLNQKEITDQLMLIETELVILKVSQQTKVQDQKISQMNSTI